MCITVYLLSSQMKLIIIKGVSIYGTRTGGQRPKTKAHEIGQRGNNFFERLPAPAGYHISIGSTI
jgi:hypothetical protein